MAVMLQEELRDTGIDVIGEVAWGTHFCQFYESKEDLIAILVPYFKAGLESNEFCMWVTCEPLDESEALAALRAALPDLDRYLASGQLEVMGHGDWYLKGGTFDARRVLDGWVEKLEQAQAKGFDGLRLTGNTFWLEQSAWADFTAYEEAVNDVIGKYRMIAICTYCLSKCAAPEIMDVIKNHQFALVRRGSGWETVESSERKRMEQQLLHVNEELQVQAEELAAQAEELRVANESLLATQGALRRSEERYRWLFERMAEGFALHEIICDANGVPGDYRFLAINPAFERITGLQKEALIGRTVREALPGIEDSWISTYGEVALTGKPIRFENYSGPLDSYFEVIAFSPERGQFATLFVDISERKRTEQERERLLRHEEEFLSIAAHELRSPMTSMKGFAQLLMRRAQRLPNGAEWLPQLATIDRQADRMAELVERLLDVSRIQLGRLELRREPVDLVWLANEAAAEARLASDKHTVEVRAEVAALVGLWEGSRLRQVLANLLSNAVQYSPRGGRIEVAVAQHDGEALVSVRDEGVGIPAEAQGALFDRYYRGDEAVQVRRVGMGLGLFICHGLVTAHGGRIWAESEPGKGSTFFFTLPLA